MDEITMPRSCAACPYLVNDLWSTNTVLHCKLNPGIVMTYSEISWEVNQACPMRMLQKKHLEPKNWR